MSAILLDDASPAFSYRQTFAEFFFIYQAALIGSCGLLGLSFLATLIVVCMRKFVCFDADEEDRKPLALKAQEHVDSSQWGVKNALHLLTGLVVVGLTAAAVCTPVVNFPDGTNFYYQGRCRGDVCQQWNDNFVQTCQSWPVFTAGGGRFGALVLIFTGTAGALSLFVVVIELCRRCCSDSCLGYDPEGDLGNPSQGYFTRWLMLLSRILVFCFHVIGVTFCVLDTLFSVGMCNGTGKVNMLSIGGSFAYGFYCLCVAVVFDFIGIWFDGVLSEVGRLVVHEDEVTLKELTAPPPTTIIPINTNNNNNDDNFHKIDNGSHNSVVVPHPQIDHPSSGDDDDESKKLIQDQQIALEKMKKEMAEQQQEFMLKLQQRQNLEQQPSALGDDQPQHDSGVDPKQKQQQPQKENDHRHDEEIAEQQKQILALQQLVDQLRLQNNSEINSTAVIPNPPLSQQPDENDTVQTHVPPQNVAQNYNSNEITLNPLVAAPPAENNNDVEDACRVDIGNETTAIAVNPLLPHQPDGNQQFQPNAPPQNQSPLILNTHINPLVFSPAAASNDDGDVCRVDIGGEDQEKADKKKKKHEKSSKNVRKHHDNAPDSAVACSRREQFDAQQRMIQQLQDEQQALIVQLQAEGGNGQNENDTDAAEQQQQ